MVPRLGSTARCSSGLHLTKESYLEFSRGAGCTTVGNAQAARLDQIRRHHPRRRAAWEKSVRSQSTSCCIVGDLRQSRLARRSIGSFQPAKLPGTVLAVKLAGGRSLGAHVIHPTGIATTDRASPLHDAVGLFMNQVQEIEAAHLINLKQ